MDMGFFHPVYVAAFIFLQKSVFGSRRTCLKAPKLRGSVGKKVVHLCRNTRRVSDEQSHGLGTHNEKKYILSKKQVNSDDLG